MSLVLIVFTALAISAEPISFVGGGIAPSPRVTEALSRALGNIDCASLLAYGPAEGLPSLRTRLAERHGGASPDDVLVTTSAQQALNLVFGRLTQTRRTVLVQEPAFFGAFRALGAVPDLRVLTFASPDELISLLAREHGAVIYLTSNYQGPWGRAMSERDKDRVARLLAPADAVVIEDNPYDLLFLDGQRPSTLYWRAPDRVIFVGGLAKIAGPGVRVGYMFARGEAARALRSAKISQDLFTPTLNQLVVDYLLCDDAYLAGVRGEMIVKRAAALDALGAAFPKESGVTFEVPRGGIFLGVRLPPDVDVEDLVALAAARGVRVESDRYTYRDQRPRQILRLNFVQNSIEDLRSGIDRLADALAELRARDADAREVIVTSGGTRVFLDDVRSLGNSSGGTTGARIAEEFLRAGYRVHFLHARGSKLPFERAYAVDAKRADDAAGLAAELDRVSRDAAEATRLRQKLILHPYVTFDEYAAGVERLATATTARAIVLAAAVSDYGVPRAAGKLSSDGGAPTLALTPLPKIIRTVKTWNPRLFQVGFKLLTGQPLAQAIDVAYRAGIDAHSNLTVLNIVDGADLGSRQNVLITPEKGLRGVATEDVAAAVVEAVDRRASRRHYRTVSEAGARHLTALSTEIATFKDHVRTLWALDLFEPYFEGARQHFGFFAMRVPGGFLITGRGSDKEHLTDEDVVFVRHVDFEQRVIHGVSSGKKASLNANVAAKIFAERADVNLILHAHVFPGLANRTARDFAPGTAEDVEETMMHLRDGEDAVELVDHGMISLGDSLDDLLACFGREPVYTRFPDAYDAVYARFGTSQDLLDAVRFVTGTSSSVLDLAAGTGGFALQLHAAGFRDLTLVDQSAGMLEQARQKFASLGQSPTMIVSDFARLDLGRRFDAVVMRQAVGYADTPERLGQLFAGVRAELREGGRFVFNAPRFGGGVGAYPDRHHRYDHGGWSVDVHERSTLGPDSILTHAQRATLIGPGAVEVRKIYDLNRFRLYTPAEFEAALRGAGFANVRVAGAGARPLEDAHKSIYVTAW